MIDIYSSKIYFNSDLVSLFQISSEVVISRTEKSYKKDLGLNSGKLSSPFYGSVSKSKRESYRNAKSFLKI